MRRFIIYFLTGILIIIVLTMPILIISLSGFYSAEFTLSDKHSLIFHLYTVYYGGLISVFIAFFVARYQIKHHISYEMEKKANSEKEFEKWFLYTYLSSFVAEIKEVLMKIEKEDVELSLSEFTFDYVSNHYTFIKELESWNPIEKVLISDILKNVNRIQNLQNILMQFDNKRNNIIIDCTLKESSKQKANDLIDQLDRIKHDKIKLLKTISRTIIQKYEHCIEIKKAH